MDDDVWNDWLDELTDEQIIKEMAHVKGFLVGVCAAYYDTDYSYVTANTAYVVPFNQNVRVIGQIAHSTSVNNSRITFNSNCYAKVTFSAQVNKGAAGTQSAYFWFKINGSDVANSTRTQQLDNGEEDNFFMVMGEFFSSGDYVEIGTAAGTTNISLNAVVATAFAPAQVSARIKVEMFFVDSATTPSI